MVNQPVREDLTLFVITRFAQKNNVKIKKVLRSRANFTLKSVDERPGDIHVDLRRTTKNYTFVYYANDCDGNTNLYNKKYTGEHVNADDLEIYKSFKPQSGYGLFFDGDIFHNWESPRTSDYRFSLIINIECEVDESVLEKITF